MKFWAHVFAALVLAGVSLGAEAVAVGETVPALSLKDQFDAAHTLDDGIRRLYVNGDRKGDGWLKDALAEGGQARLDAQKAVVIADISGAPFFVKSIIRSSLKDRKYVTWLDVTGNTKSALPYRPDRIAIVELEQRQIKAIRYVSDLEALKRELAPTSSKP